MIYVIVILFVMVVLLSVVSVSLFLKFRHYFYEYHDKNRDHYTLCKILSKDRRNAYTIGRKEDAKKLHTFAELFEPFHKQIQKTGAVSINEYDKIFHVYRKEIRPIFYPEKTEFDK